MSMLKMQQITKKSIFLNECTFTKAVLQIRCRNRKESEVLGRVGFLATVGVGVVFFVRLQKSNWIISLYHTLQLGIPVEMVQFVLKLF